MNNLASSFRAEAIRPWYRERWPWLLMAGPVAVVLASLASAWVAAGSDDGVVAQDYYKQGLLINQKMRRTPPPAPVAGATLAVTSDRRLHVQLVDAAAADARVRITFVRPGNRNEQRIDLVHSGDEWTGTLPELAPGRWIVVLASERWQLPTTVVAAPFTELRLGSVAPHS